jgi:hypothetical protein
VLALHEEGLVVLQYANDTIFMFEGKLENDSNLKVIICIFEHLTGLKFYIFQK